MIAKRRQEWFEMPHAGSIGGSPAYEALPGTVDKGNGEPIVNAVRLRSKPDIDGRGELLVSVEDLRDLLSALDALDFSKL